MQLLDQENIEKGIKVAIDTLLGFGHGEEEIEAALSSGQEVCQ